MTSQESPKIVQIHMGHPVVSREIICSSYVNHKPAYTLHRTATNYFQFTKNIKFFVCKGFFLDPEKNVLK